MRRGIVAAAAVLVTLSAWGHAWADEPADGNLVTRVVKFAATKEGSVAGKPCTVLTVTSKYGASPMDIAIPNNDANARKADPVPALMNVL